MAYIAHSSSSTYFQITAEDAEILSHDPAARDAAIAKLYAHPDCKPSFYPSDMVGDMPSPAEYDRYLEHANAAIERHTPPQTLEQRVLRTHIAAAATNVLRQYKLQYTLQDYDDLQLRVIKGYAQLFKAWMKNDFPVITRKVPSNSAHEQATHTLPTLQTPLSPPPTQHHVITTEEVADYLNNPHTLLRKQFQHTPPPGGEEDYRGMWSLESYTTRVREDQVDHEFAISLEALNGAVVPMGREEVKDLLTYSTLA
ncbi:hypothetical protein C2E23DRAFT_905335 [Lenzites betulinus]|nr:hypothetical protein C2E23DRAFT_905335 [Lenzites betulinus]